MAKVKYYYDTENLAYRKIKVKKGTKFGYGFLFLVASALFGFLSYLVILNTPFFETPKDKVLNRETENLKLRYSILNKKIDQLDEVLPILKIAITTYTVFILTQTPYQLMCEKPDLT